MNKENDFIKSCKLQKFDGNDAEYHAVKDAISASTMKLLKVSPAHYKEGEKVEETDAMIFGSAYHCYILEPERFQTDFYIFDDSMMYEKLITDGFKSPRSTKEYKEWQESEMRVIGERKVISMEQFKTIEKMKEKLMRHPMAKSLLTNGESEVGLFGQIVTMNDKTVNVKLKADYIKTKKRIVVDLKTTADASLDGFTRLAAQGDYQLQAAFYLDMVQRFYEDEMPWSFVFIAQEKKAPYAFNLFEAGVKFIGQGRYEYELLIGLYAHCLEAGRWPGYQIFCANRFGMVELNLPAYAIQPLDWFDHKF